MRDRVAVEEAVDGTGIVQPRTAAPEFATTFPSRLLTLQRSVGNRAVNRILACDACAANRTTSKGWQVDAYEADISGFYGMKGLDPSATTYPWYRSTPTIPAFMRDTAGITPDGRFEAEAVPVQLSGEDEGKAYGSITWGMTKANGKVTTDSVGYKEKPSSDFKAAASAWNAQAGSPGKRANDGQLALPTIK